MPDSGYQTTRPRPLHLRADGSNQKHKESPSEASEKRMWLLAGFVLLPLALGWVLWGTIIYKVWGGFF